MNVVGIDTSVAVPLLVTNHPAHTDVTRWAASRKLVLSGHALAETYSVLTRLPGDLRLDPADAARLIGQRFGRALAPDPDTFARLADTLSAAGISGGAVFDALVGLAALECEVTLATRDGRAKPTYERLGVRVVVVG